VAAFGGAIIVVVGFTVLILLTAKVYRDAPPIPVRSCDPAGAVVFLGEEITRGQQVFLRTD
jgi:nitric oxide reductase subunit B